MSNSVTYLNLPPMLKWYVVSGGFKKEYQKDVYFWDIESCVQNMKPIIGSTINILEGDVCPFNEYENLHFDNE